MGAKTYSMRICLNPNLMASVFVPVSFIGGTTGVFYQQFGLTLAGQVTNLLTGEATHAFYSSKENVSLERFYNYTTLLL